MMMAQCSHLGSLCEKIVCDAKLIFENTYRLRSNQKIGTLELIRSCERWGGMQYEVYVEVYDEDTAQAINDGGF